MLWQEPTGLGKISTGFKLGLTAFLIVAGIGYLLGFTNIWLTYSPVDGKPGLSVADVRIAFWGNRGATRLQKAIDGPMQGYLASEADGVKIKDWINAGGKESGFADMKGPFEACLACHSKDAKTAGVVLEDYAGVAPLLAKDTGMPISRLVTLSHIHVLATLPLIFLLCLVFSFSRFGNPFKSAVIVYSFASIVLDIGSWWLAKASGSLAVLVILGGLTLALAFAALIVLSLYDMWLRKAD
jgi:hypothetical protein